MKRILVISVIALAASFLFVTNGFCRVVVAPDPGGGGGGGGNNICGSGNSWILVKHHYTGQPVQQATVELYDVYGRRIFNQLTNACGYVFLDSLVVGNFGYRISKDGFERLSSSSFFYGDTRITLALTPVIWCGDGRCQAPEDALNCPADCPQDPCAGVNCDSYDYNSTGCEIQARNQCCSECVNVRGQFAGCTGWTGRSPILASCRSTPPPPPSLDCNSYDWDLNGCLAHANAGECTRCTNVYGQFTGCNAWTGRQTMVGNCRPAAASKPVPIDASVE